MPTITMTEEAVNVASAHQMPDPIYTSPGRLSEKRHSMCSTLSRSSSMPTFIYRQESTPGMDQENPRRSVSTHSKSTSETTLQHLKLSAMLTDRPSTFSLTVYLAITVPALALLSFLYTLCTILPLAVAYVCHASSIKESIMAGHDRLFHIHARTMELDSPKDLQNTLLMSLCTLPVSILVSLAGLFALASQLYSKLLSETDPDSISLQRAMLFWFSWLNLFCEDSSPGKSDDIV